MSTQRPQPKFLSISNKTGAIPKTNGLTEKFNVPKSDSIALVLPEEVLCKIFRYLNNKLTKKVLSEVCHEWRKIIRSDVVLSGSLLLKVTSLPLNDLSTLLTEWPKLHQFEVPFEMLEVLSNVDMRRQIIGHQMLRKIIVVQPTSGALELQGMPAWAQISKFWFDPHEKNSVIIAGNIKDLVLELESFEDKRWHRESPTSFAKCKDQGCLCSRMRCERKISDDDREYDNEIAKSMLSLECMTINYALYMIEEQVIPFVRGLQFSQNLKMLILYVPIQQYHNIESKLFETIAENCVSIRSLEIDIQADDCFDYDDVPDYIEVADLGWITSFERLEKLTIKCNVHFPSMAGVSSWHDILKEKCFFCKKMLNLKEFILDGGSAFADTTFLSRLHEAFPGLETFSMNGDMKLTDLGKRSCNCDYVETYCQLYDATWPRDKFIDVLKSLAKVKNLKLSNLNIKVQDWKPDRFEYGYYDWQFQEAFEIIKKQFPISTGLFQIQDQEYGHSIVKEEMENPVLKEDESRLHTNCVSLDLCQFVAHTQTNRGYPLTIT